MKQYIPEYKSYLQYNNYSQKTIDSYISEIEHYFSLYPTLSRSNILSYTNQIKHLKASSFNHRLSSLKSFNEYLLDNKLTDSIYIIKRDFIKQQRNGNPTKITNIQVEKFLNKIHERESAHKIRNLAIGYLIANTGIRREECCNIELVDLDLDNAELIIRGKGNKERTIPLNNIAIEYLKPWLIKREEYTYKNSPYLFISERADHMSTQSINDMFKQYATPKNKINPHALRHNLASKLLEDNILDLVQLRDFLGHSNISTTNIYTGSRQCEIKRKMKSVRIG